MYDRLNTMKLSLFERLCTNSFTLEIINQLNQQSSLKKYSILSDINTLINISNKNITEIRRLCAIELNKLKKKFQADSNTEEVLELRQLLKNSEENFDLIFERLRCF